MGRPIDTYDEISIAAIVLYSIYLVAGVYLCFKHGLGKSAGFRFIVVLSLARLVGSAMELATISDPTNVNLYIGWLTCSGVALGPLVLTLLGFLGRAFESIQRSGGRTVIPQQLPRLVQILMLVGMILIIVGGVESNYTFINGEPHAQYTTIGKAGMAIMIVVMVFVIFQAAMATLNRGYIQAGEHRIIPVVLACLPFVIVRLVYSCLLILGNVTSTVWLYLGLEIIMEIVVVTLCEILGFFLEKRVPPPKVRDTERADAYQGTPMNTYSG